MSDAAPALKNIFNPARMRHIADELAAVVPGVDRARFLAAAVADLDRLSVMERMRQVAKSLRLVLPDEYPAALDILRGLAPRLNHGFAAMAVSEYAALYGLDAFDVSMAALAEFTRYGSSEFAVRHFLREDVDRALAIMTGWTQSPDEHVRRLASEGSRPRLPWAFKLPQIIADPERIAPILGALNTDASAYVRRSVANSLNDITKDNPDKALALAESWPQDNAHTRWVVRHALRSLIKKGDPRALKLIGIGDRADVGIEDLRVTPQAVRIGGNISIDFVLRSTASDDQTLVVDYVIHYVKKLGAASGKVFKLKTVTLPAGARVAVAKRQALTDFTTRTHYAGVHRIEIQVNGRRLAETAFELAV